MSLASRPLRTVPTVGVFVSSSWLDLEAERKAVREVLERMRQTKFLGMECFGSRSENTRQASIEEVERSQVYIGVLAGRYGSGITEDEYRRARDLDLKCFIYTKLDKTIPPEWRESNAELAERLARLKEDIEKNHTVSEFSSPDDLASRIATDLGNWLFDELLSSQLESAAQGQIPRAAAEQLVAAIVDTERLDPNLVSRLRKAGFVVAAGAGSVAVGGDVIGSILVTGDRSQVFVGDYERLGDAYIDPAPVYQRVRLDRFVGRAWAIAAIDDFIATHSSGYFVLEGKAGLGKTALLAHMVRERDYIHHFVELAPGPQGVATGLKNLAAQLIGRWSLNPAGANDIVPGTATRPDYLDRLLSEAARRRNDVSPGQPIVLVIDALDEAGVPAGQNVFGLPRLLPEGVYFIVSCRPIDAQLIVDCPRRVYRLEAEDANNLADMRTYIEQAEKWPTVAAALANTGMSAAEFRDRLIERCAGIWIYAHYVLSDIERTDLSALDLRDLPKGVWQYYARFWQRWRAEHAADWDRVHLPLLSTLAAVEEHPLEHLCTLAGVENTSLARRLLEESWSAFLVGAPGKSPTYRLYHASLLEFLHGQGDLSDLTAMERVLVEELSRAAQQAHSHIANRYLDAWGGLDSGLPALAERARVDDGYGLRSTAAHLIGAGRLDDLDQFLRMETGTPPVNVWHQIRDREGDIAGYQADLMRARSAAQRACEANIAAGRPARFIAHEVRYALMSASIHSRGRNLSLSLLTALVESGVWSASKAIAHARDLSQPKDRALALSAFSDHLPEERADILAKALDEARACGAMDAAEALTAVAGRLTGEQREEVLNEAVAKWCIVPEGPYWGGAYSERDERVRVLSELAPLLPPHLLRRVLDVTRGLTNLEVRGKALTALAPSLPVDWLADALAALGPLPSDYRYQWIDAFTSLFPALPESLRMDAWRMLMASWDDRDKAFPHLVAKLWRWLPEPVCLEALGQARKRRDPYLLEAMLTAVPPAMKPAVAADAVAAARRLPRRKWREVSIRMAGAVALRIFGGNPRRSWQQRVLSALANRYAFSPHSYDSDERRRVEIIAAALPYLRGILARARAVTLARVALGRIEQSDWDRDEALTRLVAGLPSSLVGLGVRRVARVANLSKRSLILARCACRLREPRRSRILTRAFDTARMIEDGIMRSDALLDISTLLNGTERSQAVAEAAAMRPIDDAQSVAAAIGSLAADVPSEQQTADFRDALAAASREVLYPHRRVRDLLPHLPEEMLPEALALAVKPAWVDSEEEARREALEAAVPRLPPALVSQALTALETTKRRGYSQTTRAQVAIVAQRSRLDEAERQRLVREAYADLRHRWDDDMPEDLVELAPFLPPALLDDLRPFASSVLARAIETDNEYTVRRVVPVLQESERSMAFRFLLNRSRPDHSSDFDWARTLGRLAEFIPEDLVPNALAAACQMSAYSSQRTVASAGAEDPRIAAARRYRRSPGIFTRTRARASVERAGRAAVGSRSTQLAARSARYRGEHR